jgi:urease accessory protein
MLMAIVALWPARPAAAHLVSTRLGPFYDGAAHTLVSLEDVLSILALALLAGLGGPRHGRMALVWLAGGWLAGTAAALALGGAEISLPLLAAGTFLAIGAAVAANLPTAPIVIGAAATIIGLARGALDGTAAVAAGGSWLAAAGGAAGALVLMALLLAMTVSVGRGRGAIVLRVAGSWLAAIGLLMAGWQIHAGL